MSRPIPDGPTAARTSSSRERRRVVLAPTIATALVRSTGTTAAVTPYLAGMTVLGLAATLVLRDRTGIPLGPDHEELQAAGPIYGLAKA